ncbi:MAG: hypothetical protein LBQ64_01820, partial [Bacteroidales bacterium]|nr:hypothetical protein [Bacteroidales bacterium]
MKPRLWTKRTNVFRQWVCILIVYAACVFKIREMSLGFQSLSSVDVFAFLYAYSDVCWLLISILLFLNAISLLFFLRRYSLTGIRNYHPMFLYLLLSFVFPCTITLWGMLTILVTINGLFPQLFDMDEKNIYVKTFIYGLWCGLLSLLYTPFLLLLI